MVNLERVPREKNIDSDKINCEKRNFRMRYEQSGKTLKHFREIYFFIPRVSDKKNLQKTYESIEFVGVYQREGKFMASISRQLG